MKGKTEYIILAIIIAAIGAYLGLHRTDRSTYELPQLSMLPKKEISKIEITVGNKPLILNRQGDQWQIDPHHYPADPEKIGRILDIISNLTLTAMVSESKSDQRFDLSPEKRIRVKAWVHNGPTREFDVGKPVDTFRHTFVKISGDDRVFHADLNFRDRFEMTAAQLRDKHVLAFATADITSFTITKDQKTTKFQRQEASPVKTDQKDPSTEDAAAAAKSEKEKTWKTDTNQVADSAKIQMFLSTLSDLEGQDFLNDDTRKNLKDPLITITLTGPKTYQLAIYQSIDKNAENPLWPAISSENDDPFHLADWQVTDIVKAPAGLMPDAPTPEKTKEILGVKDAD